MSDRNTRTDGVIRMLPGERFTPFALAKKLNAGILFESSSFERGHSRYSLLELAEIDCKLGALLGALNLGKEG